jgi:hypothetical protein
MVEPDVETEFMSMAIQEDSAKDLMKKEMNNMQVQMTNGT